MEMPIYTIYEYGEAVNVIHASSGTAFVIGKGESLSVYDLEGRQVSDLFCVSKEDPGEVFSSARSMDYNDTIYLSSGHILYSNRSRPMLKIVEDTCLRHDLLMPPCSLKMFQIVANDDDLYHPSCQENLSKNLNKFGIPDDVIHSSFNIFMNVDVQPNGGVKINSPLSKPMDKITFEAQMDLIVALTACSHEETNGGRLKPIGFTVSSR